LMGISLSAILVKLSAAPSVVTASCRLVCAVLLMSPVVFVKAKFREELFAIDFKQFLKCLLSGIVLAVHFALWFESLKKTSVASSTVIVCNEVIWVSLGYTVFMKGKISKKAVLCIAAAILGSIIIAFSDSAGGGGDFYGDMLALLASIAGAIYTLLGRAARKTMSTTVYTYVLYAVCSAVLLLMTAFQGYSVQEFDQRTILVGLLLAVFSTILGHSVFTWCLKYFSPSFVSASKLCEPIIATLIAVPVFQEIPGFLQIAGGIIVIAGVFFYSTEEKKQLNKASQN